jgi:hypothetical protein
MVMRGPDKATTGLGAAVAERADAAQTGVRTGEQ